jgi:Mn2+/Fe2+ NRAMP family transporter
MATDNYRIDHHTIKEPPTTFLGKLKLLGPGFILSASIVGSGELIATTTLGAKAGFVAFWIIIVSCLAKVAVQLEFGKHTIISGETAMQAMSKLPGPLIGNVRWSVVLIFFLMVLKVVQLGGMIGSTAIVLDLLIPGIPLVVWVGAIALITSLLIYKGYYVLVEKVSLFMIAMFTVFTILAVYALVYSPFSFSFADVIRNQSFTLSAPVISVAIGAFGITGVASDEIIAYNYWCREKGYAAYTGPQQDDDAWRRRAKGWIRVMYLDAILAMVIYTMVTAAFYLLGAAVLHKLGITPEGNEVIETLSLIYTKSLGPEVRVIYLVGAFFVLFSSLVATNAAWTRIYSDVFGQLGWLEFNDSIRRGKVVAILAWIFPFIWGMTYLFIALPVAMILTGGFVGSFMLFLIVFAGLHFRYARKQFFKASLVYDVALWISVISIAAVGAYGIGRLF